MSNLDITQRKSLERSTLSDTESLRHGTERGAAIYSVVAIVIGVVLSYAALTTIDNWSQWIVLGVIVVTTIGAMIALSPTRRST